jgi:DNA-binding NarL/FixJ family response regulator
MGYRVILVDDHTIVRHGLAALLRNNGKYLVVAEAANGEEGLTCAKDIEADLMILDLSMPRMNGLETIRRLSKQSSRLKILVLSMYDDEQFVAQALRDGARGYILKHAMDEELFQALDAVARGEQ